MFSLVFLFKVQRVFTAELRRSYGFSVHALEITELQVSPEASEAKPACVSTSAFNVFSSFPPKEVSKWFRGEPKEVMHALNEAKKQRRNRDTALVDMSKLLEERVGCQGIPDVSSAIR